MIEVHFQVSLFCSCMEFFWARLVLPPRSCQDNHLFFFSPLLPAKSSLHEQPLQSSISLPFISIPSEHSGRLFAHPSLLSPRLSLYIFTSATWFSPWAMWAGDPLNPSLSGLTVHVAPERITPLTSLCQMFTTKIDRTTNLDAESNNACGLNSTLLFPIYAWAASSVLIGNIRFCLMISPVSFVSNASLFSRNQSCCLHYLVQETKLTRALSLVFTSLLASWLFPFYFLQLLLPALSSEPV